MAGGRSILAIDQGTTSTRAILFDQAGQVFRTRRPEVRLRPLLGETLDMTRGNDDALGLRS